MAKEKNIRPVPGGKRPRFPLSGRSGAGLVLLGLLCLAGPAAPGAETEISKEYQVKAAFLYNFTKFVEWPGERFADPDTPIVIGVFNGKALEAELGKVVEGRLVNGRRLVVRPVTTAADAASAHLVFVPAGEEERFAGAAAALREAAVVTVGESARFAALGGMIVFTREEDKVRFAINLESSERARVRFSAQLLKLASAVRRKS